MRKNIVVIGGGPAGMTAAIFAAQGQTNVTLLEKGSTLGRKLLLTGGGRCNITNNKAPKDIIEHIPGNGKFLYSSLSQFGPKEIMQFFQRAGTRLKEEAHGRIFPADNQSTTILNGFLYYLKKQQVQIRTKAAVKEIHFLSNENQHLITLENGDTLLADAIIIATGGQTMPKTGSSGDAYPWAKEAGHTVTHLYPTEVPLLVFAPFIKTGMLQGLTFPDCILTVLDTQGKKYQEIRHDVLFTHFGISGPAALRASAYVQKLKQAKNYAGKPIQLQFDVCPDIKEDALYQDLLQKKRQEPLKSLKSLAKSFTQERYARFLLEWIQADENIKLTDCKNDTLRQLAHLFKAFPIPVSKTLGFEKAFVTGGGISIKEINPKTMASKKMNGLYFCGEVLDIHAHTGGYNLTAAMSTGACAGQHAGI